MHSSQETHCFAKRNAGRRAMRRSLAGTCMAVGILATSAGCSMIGNVGKSLAHNTALNETMLAFRNHSWSAKSWHSNQQRFCEQPHFDHFEAGYRAGYQSVASGGNGCAPPLPPRKYWGWTYQSPTGKAKADAWFAGFPYGAAAAEQDGLQNWSELSTRVRTSPTSTAQIPTSPKPEHLPISTATLAAPVSTRVAELLPAPREPAGKGVGNPVAKTLPTGMKRPNYVDIERLIEQPIAAPPPVTAPPVSAPPVSGLPNQLH